MAELGEFVKHQEDFKALGAKVIGISIRDSEKVRATAEKLRIPFPILSDERGLVMDLYRTRAPEASGLLNVPTLVIVDSKGVIRWIHQAED